MGFYQAVILVFGYVFFTPLKFLINSFSLRCSKHNYIMLLGFCFGIQVELVFFAENGVAFFKKNDKVPSPKVLGLNSSADRVGSDPTALPDHKGHVIPNPRDTT